MQVTQPRDQSIDETELEVERTKPIFGEALAFYTAGANLSLVVYYPLIECHKQFGRWFGKWSSAMFSLTGIWTYNDHAHILQRHPGPGLYLLKPDEYQFVAIELWGTGYNVGVNWGEC
jgi:hypothetical protein